MPACQKFHLLRMRIHAPVFAVDEDRILDGWSFFSKSSVNSRKAAVVLSSLNSFNSPVNVDLFVFFSHRYEMNRTSKSYACGDWTWSCHELEICCRSAVLYAATEADLPASADPVGRHAVHGRWWPTPGHLVAQGKCYRLRPALHAS